MRGGKGGGIRVTNAIRIYACVPSISTSFHTGKSLLSIALYKVGDVKWVYKEASMGSIVEGGSRVAVVAFGQERRGSHTPTNVSLSCLPTHRGIDDSQSNWPINT